MKPDLGRVLAFHPSDHSCDLQMVSDGSHQTGVRIGCPMITTSSGRVDLHEPEDNEYNKPGSSTRDVVAMVIYFGDTPAVIGFLPDQVCELMFDRKDFRIDRHASDFYETLDAEGNYELAHPSGTYIRIAEDPEHEDLTGQDFDEKFEVTRNKQRAPWLSIRIVNDGETKMTLRADPEGNVLLQHTGNLTTNTEGNADVTVGGTLDVTVVGDATITAANLTINAPVAINGDSLTHNGVNVGDSHVHGGIQGGPSDTEGPH